MPDNLPDFDGPTSRPNIDQADILEGDLRPEGREDPGVDLAKLAKAPDALTGLVDELKAAGDGGDRTPKQVLEEIRTLLKPKEEGEAKPVDPVQQARAEFRQYAQMETAIRDALMPLTDAQKVLLIRMQYPESYTALNRLEGADLDDAIVDRVFAGEVKYAKRGGPDTEVSYNKFHDDRLSPQENKVVEMALNKMSNLDIAVEMGLQIGTIRSLLSRARRKLGDSVEIPRGATGQSLDGHAPGTAKAAAVEAFEEGLDTAAAHQRLAKQGIKVPPQTVYQYYSRWKSAKAKGLKFAMKADPDLPGQIPKIQSGYEPRDLILMFNDRLDFARMGMELSIATGKPINPGSLRTLTTNVRTALRKLRETPDQYAIAAEKMNLTIDEIDAFIDKLGDRRAPSLAAEARRLLREGVTATKDIIDALKVYGEKHRLDFKDGVILEQTISHARIDLGLNRKQRASVNDGLDPRGSSIDELMTRLSAEFGDGAGALVRTGEVNISAFPPRWADPDVMGITDANGRVELYAINIDPDDMRGLILHEVGVHAGLPEILGYEGFQDMLADAWGRYRKGEKAFVAAYDRIPLDTDPDDIQEELVAYLVQHAPKTKFVQKLLADVRAWLWKTFPTMREWMTLTAADLQSLALGAVRSRIRQANSTITVGKTRAGGAFSTSDARYARRAREPESSSEGRGAEVPGGARQPGRADVRPDGSAGAGAPRGGAVQPGSQSGRAVATEPLPKAPADAGLIDWNERLKLTPEQRAERRAQFRDFVDAVEFLYEHHSVMTDWGFRNGKRTVSKAKRVESRRYEIRRHPEWHQSWHEAGEPENTALHIEIHGAEATIHNSHIADEFRSTGLGEKLYRRAIDDMLENVDDLTGLPKPITVNSDVSMSENALALWKSLRKRGYDVIQRVPDSLLERGPDGQYSAADESTAIFFIARKKPPLPELPQPTRDVMIRLARLSCLSRLCDPKPCLRSMRERVSQDRFIRPTLHEVLMRFSRMRARAGNCSCVDGANALSEQSRKDLRP